MPTPCTPRSACGRPRAPSAERIRAELLKLLVCRAPPKPWPTVAASGFLDRILAGVADVRAFAALADRTRPARRSSALAALALRTARRRRPAARAPAPVQRRRPAPAQDRARCWNACMAASASSIARSSANGATDTATPLSATRWPSPPRAAGNGRARRISPQPRRCWKAPRPVCPFGGGPSSHMGSRPAPIVGAIVARAEVRLDRSGLSGGPGTFSPAFWSGPWRRQCLAQPRRVPRSGRPAAEHPRAFRLPLWPRAGLRYRGLRGFQPGV